MTSAREDVTGASAQLRAAEYKILEMELDITQLAQRANASDIEAAKAKQELSDRNAVIVGEYNRHPLLTSMEVILNLPYHKGLAPILEGIRKLKKDYGTLKESHENQLKAFGALQDVILGKDSVTETYDDLLAPVQDLANLKLFVKYHLGIASNDECSVRKLQHELSKVLRSRSTEERDSILSQIREVLGAKGRGDDGSYAQHESALQAAKRVMEELKDEKYEHKLTKVKLRNTIKDSTGRTYTPPDGYVLLKATEFEETLERALTQAAKKIFS